MTEAEDSRVARTYVDIEDPEHVVYWTTRFFVTEISLRDAVETVGPKAVDVARRLGKPYPPD